jgi:AraC-like DNA-binding protein
MVVNDILQKLDIIPISVTLGELVLAEEPDNTKRNELQDALQSVGFELIDNKRNHLIEQVKEVIIELVHRNNSDLKINLSDYISDKIHHDYSYISNLFSEIENTTVEKYFIAQRIERVKELLVYDELNLNEIADLLNYSSVAHLCAQFKKNTGFTPRLFKQVKENKRKPLDKV